MQHQKQRRWGRWGWLFAPALCALTACALLAPREAASGGGLNAYAFQPRLGAPGAFIKVEWSRPSSVPSSYILGYVIWRGSAFAPVQVVGGLDSDARHNFLDSEATRNVTAWDGVPGSDDAGARTVFQSVSGLVPGQLYSYQVAAAYVNGLQDRDHDGMPDQGNFMSPLSMRSQFVTALAPPRIFDIDGAPPSGATLVNPKSFTVQWEQTPGADTYEIWISRNPNFKGSKLRIKPPKTLPVDLGGPQTVSETINAYRGGFRRASVFYITVGARNSKDRIKPRPFGAIFSAPVAVQVEDVPPDNP